MNSKNLFNSRTLAAAVIIILALQVMGVIHIPNPLKMFPHKVGGCESTEAGCCADGSQATNFCDECKDDKDRAGCPPKGY